MCTHVNFRNRFQRIICSTGVFTSKTLKIRIWTQHEARTSTFLLQHHLTRTELTRAHCAHVWHSSCIWRDDSLASSPPAGNPPGLAPQTSAGSSAGHQWWMRTVLPRTPHRAVVCIPPLEGSAYLALGALGPWDLLLLGLVHAWWPENDKEDVFWYLTGFFL